MRRYNSFLTLLVAVWLCAISHAGIYNGGFEEAEPNGVPDQYGRYFYPPKGWLRGNYAAVLEQFVPDPNMGDFSNWIIDIEEGLQPFDGESFVVLSTGDIDPNAEWAYIKQYIYVYPGETISGYYFFGTTDWEDYPDWASIKLIPVDPNSNPRGITLVLVDVKDVGSYSSMNGWEYFEHTFIESEEGGYNLIIRVDDYWDELYSSYLAVDGMILCDYPSGDIDLNCQVNLADFSWMATDWLEDCNDPNYLTDPNSNCYKGTDLDGSGPVDINDLMLMTDNWLYQP